MRSEFFALANANETQRSGATLSGMSGRKREKFASHLGAFSFGNSINCAICLRVHIWKQD